MQKKPKNTNELIQKTIKLHLILREYNDKTDEFELLLRV